MPRLYRPHCPVSVCVKVAERQVTETTRLAAPAKPLSARLRFLLEVIARKAGCSVEDLRRDHDPALALRPQERRGLGRKTYYTPDANDPEHMLYRPHGAQFDGSHDVKTRIRGEHGQFSDVVLIKRERRRQKKAASKTTAKGRPEKRKSKIESRGFDKTRSRGFNGKVKKL